MGVLNQTIKIVLGSGALLLLLWVAMLVFSANSMDSEGSDPPAKSNSKQPQYERRKYVEPEPPNTPWRTVSLTAYPVPPVDPNAPINYRAEEQHIVLHKIDSYSLRMTPFEPKSNLTFLFLHGAAFTAKEWADLGTMGFLARSGYASVAVDLPGFGQTPTKLGADKETYVSKVEYFTSLVRGLKLDKDRAIVMVSPSFSGNYALPFVLTHPEWHAGLVVIAPAASGIVPPSKLRALQVPTMLIYGKKDISLGEISHQDLKRIPNFQAVILENAGHAAYLDQPDKFHSLLYNFVKRVETYPKW